MNIEKKETGKLVSEITLKLTPEDYSEIFRKRFAEQKRRADFKGFRKGHVPDSLVKKVFGGQILVDSVNEVIGSGLDNYIRENKLRLLGEPLPSENQPENVWEEGKDFTFIFDIARYPEVSVDVVKADTITRYEISATAKEKEGMKENLKKYYEEKKDAEPKTDEEIDAEIEERLKGNYAQQSEWRLSKDIRNFYVEKAAVELPDEFLKRWLLASNGEKVTAEDVEKEYPGFAEDFKWQIVRSHLMEKFGLDVKKEDVEEAAKAYVTYQYAMYGLSEAPAEMINEAADRMLRDSKQIDRLSEQVEDRKVMDKIRQTATFKNKKITSEKFYELK
ncbi:MAG: trigger factor family protein [Bacteroidales bacterium]|nr:trigger factor family protein [Bacteroidales bacterium]